MPARCSSVATTVTVTVTAATLAGPGRDYQAAAAVPASGPGLKAHVTSTVTHSSWGLLLSKVTVSDFAVARRPGRAAQFSCPPRPGPGRPARGRAAVRSEPQSRLRSRAAESESESGRDSGHSARSSQPGRRRPGPAGRRDRDRRTRRTRKCRNLPVNPKN
jgi:hypothetical protein